MKFTYKIIITQNNKQIEFVGVYPNKIKAEKKFHALHQENKANIRFPIEFINTGRKIQPVKYELVLIKYNEEQKESTFLRNDYGEFVEYQTNNKDWIVYDRVPYYKEESFWVYGYHPLVQRKSFDFIFQNIIAKNAVSSQTFLCVMAYRNKLYIESTNNADLITCKNTTDCIRLYNELEKECNTKKYKYILFSGNWNDTKERRQEIVDKIKKLTNWNELKIKRNNTRP